MSKLITFSAKAYPGMNLLDRPGEEQIVMTVDAAEFLVRDLTEAIRTARVAEWNAVSADVRERLKEPVAPRVGLAKMTVLEQDGRLVPVCRSCGKELPMSLRHRCA